MNWRLPHVNWPLIAGCVLACGIAVAAWAVWIAVTGRDRIPVPVVVLGALGSAVLARAVDEVRRRRAHARPSKTRKTA